MKRGIIKRGIMNTNSRLWIAVAIVLLAAAALGAAAPGYHVVTTYKLGGDGGWDYLTVDASARRLYISRGTHVMVVDADTGKSVGDIADTPGVHGIALAPETGPRLRQQRARRHGEHLRHQDTGDQQ